MARLRVRIELNRRMAGVPLDKMASVVEETRKFFYLLSEDVQHRSRPRRVAGVGLRPRVAQLHRRIRRTSLR